jgi:hypothetical protein
VPTQFHLPICSAQILNIAVGKPPGEIAGSVAPLAIELNKSLRGQFGPIQISAGDALTAYPDFTGLVGAYWTAIRVT